MDNTVKPLSCLLLLTILVCGLFFQVSYASGASEPSVPEFTVELVAYPYDVPPVTTTKIDEYTGEETVKTTPGYHVEDRSIEVVIKNQPFTPYVSQEDTPLAAGETEVNLYYNVRRKGHFGEDWEELYPLYRVSSRLNPVQSSSEYTVLKFSADYPDGAQVDFQVKAIIGYFYNTMAGRPAPPINVLAAVESSDWSNTQTITISEENVQVRLNEEIPEFPSWTILPMTLTVAVVVAVYKRKLTKHSSY